eukprot:RCo044183
MSEISQPLRSPAAEQVLLEDLATTHVQLRLARDRSAFLEDRLARRTAELVEVQKFAREQRRALEEAQRKVGVVEEALRASQSRCADLQRQVEECSRNSSPSGSPSALSSHQPSFSSTSRRFSGQRMPSFQFYTRESLNALAARRASSVSH